MPKNGIVRSAEEALGLNGQNLSELPANSLLNADGGFSPVCMFITSGGSRIAFAEDG
jgi:hypothetical protein